jgi:Pyruvate phosphate dikinase, AMP/ATP-binding domain
LVEFHSETRLAQRLSAELRNPTKRITLMIGSGAAVPAIPDVNGILDLVDEYVRTSLAPLSGPAFSSFPAEFEAIRRTATTRWEAYTKYYQVLEGMAGKAAFDLIIQQAVRTAFVTPKSNPLNGYIRKSPWGPLDLYAADMESESQFWRLPDGLKSLGHLLAERPSVFGNRVLTTNFDPLIELSIRVNGGRCSTQSYKTDGSLDTLVGSGPEINVVHLHGYWRSNPTDKRSLLHSPTALTRPRLTLLANLADLIRETLVVVVGYGAWDDVFTGALSNLSTAQQCEILWCFYSDEQATLASASEALVEKIGDPQSVVFYKGVDSNRLFPVVAASLDAGGGAHTKPATQAQPRYKAARRTIAPDVLLISDTSVTSSKYGPKAATLSTLKRGGVRVPDGYCIDLTTSTVDVMQRNGQLREIWNTLSGTEISASRTNSIIVRSSASVEDSSLALFPGRFASRKDVNTFTDLIVGINACVASHDSPAVKQYQEMLELSPDRVRVGVIIQHQVPAVLSGVAFTDAPAPYEEHELLVEMVSGVADELLIGNITGSLYSYKRANGQESYHHLIGPPVETSLIAKILARLSDVCEKVTSLLGEPQDIEWVWDGKDLYIVQARPIRSSAPQGGVPISVDSDQGEPNTPFLPMADKWGLKAAAALYFRRYKQGARNAIVVPPDSDAGEVASALNGYNGGEHGTVIRFSVEAHVGVSKRFVPPGGDIIRAYLDTRQNNSWVGIVSDFVYLESSFEAYVSDKALLVEHVPGNWEPANQLPPDVFLWTESRFEFLRVASPRDAAVEVPSARNSPGVLRRLVPAIPDDVAARWASRMIERFSAIRADMSSQLPVNVHFVADGGDEWYFLNIRPTTHLHLERSERLRDDSFKANRLFLVVTPNDVRHWDRRSRILVNCAADRGGLGGISVLAASLRDAGVNQVFCTFGVLSHPAILLREFGLTVVPLYLDHESRQIEAPRW